MHFIEYPVETNPNVSKESVCAWLHDGLSDYSSFVGTIWNQFHRPFYMGVIAPVALLRLFGIKLIILRSELNVATF